MKKKHRTEKTILSLNVKDIFCTSSLLWNDIIIIVVVVVIEFTGYGGFAVVNTTVVVVEKNIPVLFKRILLYFLMIMIIKTGLISIIRRTNQKKIFTEKISISLFYQCCDNYF